MPTLRKVALHKITAAIFRATGAPDDIAAQVADVLIDNHLAGHDSHGILRIPEYVQSVRAGEIVPTARPYVIEELGVDVEAVAKGDTHGKKEI